MDMVSHGARFPAMSKKENGHRFTPTRIREWREHRGLTLEQLAGRLDDAMSAGNLSRLERGLIPYSQETLELIAQALDVAVADLFDRAPPSKELEEWLALLEKLAGEKRAQALRVVKALSEEAA